MIDGFVLMVCVLVCGGASLDLRVVLVLVAVLVLVLVAVSSFFGGVGVKQSMLLLSRVGVDSPVTALFCHHQSPPPPAPSSLTSFY